MQAYSNRQEPAFSCWVQSNGVQKVLGCLKQYLLNLKTQGEHVKNIRTKTWHPPQCYRCVKTYKKFLVPFFLLLFLFLIIDIKMADKKMETLKATSATKKRKKEKEKEPSPSPSVGCPGTLGSGWWSSPHLRLPSITALTRLPLHYHLSGNTGDGSFSHADHSSPEDTPGLVGKFPTSHPIFPFPSPSIPIPNQLCPLDWYI